MAQKPRNLQLCMTKENLGRPSGPLKYEWQEYLLEITQRVFWIREKTEVGGILAETKRKKRSCAEIAMQVTDH